MQTGYLRARSSDRGADIRLHAHNGEETLSMSRSKDPRHHLVYSDRYETDLSVLGTPVDFAPSRGRQVLARLRAEFGEQIVARRARQLTFKQIAQTHDHKYLQDLKDAATWSQIFGVPRVLPHSRETARILARLFYDYRLKSGGTFEAAKLALKYGLAANLGGGYHHAHRDRGDGFCLINDIAMTTNLVISQGLCKKVMVVDLDFHQGNGSASILYGRDDVFILDVFAREGWPYRKEPVDLAVPLSTRDSHLYLDKLKAALTQALGRFAPDLVLFVQGADAFEYGLHNRGDNFALTLDQMKERDELVIDTMVERGIPLAMVFAGGYGPRAWEAHYQGVRHLLIRSEVLRSDLP